MLSSSSTSALFLVGNNAVFDAAASLAKTNNLAVRTLVFVIDFY